MVVKKAADAMAMAGAVRAKEADDADFGSRIDEAALRVLEAKGAAGLLPCSVA